MFDLKPISKEAIPHALEKAQHYRLLNDPLAAESICLDVLDVDRENQQAIVTLILALADRLAGGYMMGAARARDLLPRIIDNYQRTYYCGIICERQAYAVLAQGVPGSRVDAYEWLRDAMECYKEAETIRPQGNDDSILRWNTCVRVIKNNNLEPRSDEVFEPYLE